MTNNEKILIEELEKEIRNKNELLKCLNTVYTGALEFIEKQDYDGFLAMLDDQQSLIAKIDESECNISLIVSKFESDRRELLDFLLNDKDTNDVSVALKSVAHANSVSKKLLKNSKTLNEKLIYKVKEVQNGLRNNLIELKNHKLIRSAYSHNNQPKTGLIIDYKNN